MTPAPPRSDNPSGPLLDNIARHLAAQWKAPMAAIVHDAGGKAALLASVNLDPQAQALALAAAASMAPGATASATELPGPAIRFLAAAPLTDTSGQRIGALIVMDRRARAARSRNLAALTDLATVVSLSLMMQNSLERLELLAVTDPLTGLYNRRGLDLLFAEHAHAPMALLAIDVDDFKAVNDAYGHSAGDALLTRVADALRQSVRVSDIVARTGGDEFLILLPDTADPAIATQVAARIHQAMQTSTVSIGITHTPIPAALATLKAAAEQNLRAAKQHGKARTIAG